jgi:hypothetical protein
MSEKDNANERNETGDESQSLNRRRFVKGLGVAGGAAVFGSVGAGNVAAKGGSNSLFDRTQLDGNAAKAAIHAALEDNTSRTVVSELDHGLSTGEATAYTVTGPSLDQEVTQVLVPVAGVDQNLTYATNGADTAAGVKTADKESIQSLDLTMYQSQGVEHKRIAGENEAQDVLRVAQQSETYQTSLRELQSKYDARPADAEAAFIEERQEAIVVIPAYKKNGSRRPNTDPRVLIARIDTTNGAVVEANGGFASCLLNCGVGSVILFGPCYEICLSICGGTGGVGCFSCLVCVGLSGSFCGLQCI